MILSNNEAALAAVKALSSEEIIAMVKAADLMEYGSEAISVFEKWEAAGNAKIVVGALNNADTETMLTIIAKENPIGVVAGLAAAVKAIGAESALLILADGEANEKLTALAKEAGVPLIIEAEKMVDIRAHAEDVLMHLETLAAIANILTAKTYGTVISVNGETPVEIPFGTKLGDVIKADGVKALLINHKFYPASVLETPITPDFPIGSGVITVVKDTDCIVSQTVKALRDLRAKSCGKCTFCREGLFQLHTIFIDITQGKAKDPDMDLAAELCDAMTFSTLCTLGKEASAPVLSALEGFRGEIDSHIKKKVCPTGMCTAFTTLYVDPTKCEGCGECIDVCPADCIEGKSGYISIIDEFDCTKCGKCLQACPNGAIQRTTGRLPKLPDHLTRVGRFRKN